MDDDRVVEIASKAERTVESDRFRHAAKIVAILAVGALMGIGISGDFQVQDLLGPKKPKLTKYQQNYVDCPPKYLELCTKMSKIPTEPVKFQDAREGKLYLELQDGRTMVARIQDGGKDGYLIRITS